MKAALPNGAKAPPKRVAPRKAHFWHSSGPNPSFTKEGSGEEAHGGEGLEAAGRCMRTGDPLDLDALLGVTFDKPAPRGRKPVPVDCGQSPPREKPRFTEWSNIHTFEARGYIARVDRWSCSCCENLYDTLEGVFVLEVHLPTGTRRLTALAKGGQFPLGQDFAKEVTEHSLDVCGNCIGDLGFSREVGADGLPYTLVLGGSQARPGGSKTSIPGGSGGTSSGRFSSSIPATSNTPKEAT